MAVHDRLWPFGWILAGEDFGEERIPKHAFLCHVFQTEFLTASLLEEWQTLATWDNDLAIASQHRFGRG